MSFLRRLGSYLANPSAQPRPVTTGPQLNDACARIDADYVAPPRLRLRHITGNPLLLIGLVIVSGMFLMALFGPLLASYDPFITTQSEIPHYDKELGQMVTPPYTPSAQYPLGTDQWGNDILSLILYGAQVTLVAAIFITLIRLLIGTLLGLVAGWQIDRPPDRLVMGAISVVSAIPILLSSMILVLALGIQKGLGVFIIGLSLVGWGQIAQFVRSELMVIRRMLYIEAAEATGLNSLQIVVRHTLPNILPPLLIMTFLEMGAVLLLMAELGFLGIFIGGGSRFTLDPVFGRQPVILLETAEWGALIARGVPYLRSYPHIVFGPALAFFFAILGLNALGEGLRRLIEYTGLGTGFLLSRWIVPAAVAVAIISAIIINATGAKRSYQQLAEGFQGEQAQLIINDLVQLAGQPAEGDDPPPAAAFIADKFKEYDIARGWQIAFGTSYYSDVTADPTVVGFIPGYDMDLTGEMVVLFASYSNSSAATANSQSSGVGVLLELARLWQERNLDPRRSVILVAWGGDPQDQEQIQNWLEDEENFNGLPVLNREGGTPTMVFQLDYLAAGDELLWLDDDSDEVLLALLRESAREMGVRTTQDAAEQGAAEGSVLSGELPAVYFHWANPLVGPADTLESVSTTQLKSAGETLALTLCKILLQTEYQ